MTSPSQFQCTLAAGAAAQDPPYANHPLVRKVSFLVASVMAGCSTSPIPSLDRLTADAPMPAALSPSAPARPASEDLGYARPEAIADAARPWRRIGAIWFSYAEAEMAASEASTIAKIARYLSEHPASEIAINPPSATWAVEPNSRVLNPRRMDAIHAALAGAGVRSSQIMEGSVADPLSTLDRMVVISVRNGP